MVVWCEYECGSILLCNPSIVTGVCLSLCTAPGASRPVKEPAVVWFIEIIWQGSRLWKAQLEQHFWWISYDLSLTLYSFLLWKRHPTARVLACMRGNKGQASDNMRTVCARQGRSAPQGTEGGSVNNPNAGRKPHGVKVAFVINN